MQFFEKKWLKSLQVNKKNVPLHRTFASQMRNKASHAPVA